MASACAEIPAHVRPEQVVDYDYFDDPRLEGDVHIGMRSLHFDAPDVFYSPRNGGFWVVTRHDLMKEVLRDTEHFSNRELSIPKSNSPNLMIPLNLDPPEHLPFRMVLMRQFDRKVITGLEPRLRNWANHLIDRVIEMGECEFAEDVGAGFPVSVFMELMGLPLERFEEFRGVVHEYFSVIPTPRRIELQETIIGIMRHYFDERRHAPRDDLISRLTQEEVKGRPLTDGELDSIGFLLFIAGLDTVANTLTFTFHYLAKRPDLQAELVANPERMTGFVEEALRRFSIVNQTRIVKKDFDFAGGSFRVGDMVACPLALAGLDDRRNADPEAFLIDRPQRAHLAFSIGPHTCVGNILARAEMRVFTEEWLKRIPAFELSPGRSPKWRSGGVMALSDVYLRWRCQTSVAAGERR